MAVDCLGNNNVKIATASGFIVSPNGKIVTNFHVIQPCSGLTIRLTNGDIYDMASVLEVDPRKDLAVIRVKAASLPVLALGESNDLEIGQVVYSIGNAGGLQNTLQQGLISAIRQLTGLKVLQVSASINHGNSGGPILDSQANVIGVAAAMIAGAENLGFAIPIDYAKGFLDSKNEIAFPTFAAAMRVAAANAPKTVAAAPPPPPLPSPTVILPFSGDPAKIGSGGGIGAPPAAVPALTFRSVEAFAGRPWQFQGDGMPALEVPLGHLHGVALDHAGNIFFTDIGSQVVGKIDTAGKLHVLLGPASPPQNRPVVPQGVAVDSSGVVYFAEDGQRVRKILPSGEVVVVAGNNRRAFTADGAVAATSSISGVNGVTVAADGSVLFSEWGNNRVRRVNEQGQLQTVAGDGELRFAGDGGPAQQASLQRPMSLALDAEGSLYIADEFNGRVRKVTKDGLISTVAGGGVTKDPLGCPTGVAINSKGDLFIADPCRKRVLKVSNGTSTVVGGTGVVPHQPSGMGGPAISAGFDVWALAVNDQDDIVVAAPDNGYLYRISHNGTISIVAGAGNWRAPTDGMQAANAYFQQPQRVAVDRNGGLVFSDLDANRIYRIDSRGVVNRVAGFPYSFYNGEQVAAAEAGIDHPMGIRVRPNGAIVFAERSDSSRIREISPDGKIRTLAGNGRRDYSGDGGRAVNASLNVPLGICLDSSGAVYLADTGNNRVRKILPNGTIQLVAGNGTAGFSGDGGPAERAALNTPVSVDIAPDGTLYIADAGNRRIRKVSADGGIISTVAGDGMNRFAGDGGPAVKASFGWPYDVAVGPDRAIYVVDSNNARIRRVDPTSGTIVTVAGNGNHVISGDNGAPELAGLGNMGGIAFDSAGNLFVVEAGDGLIRVLRVSSPGTATNVPGGLAETEKTGCNQVGTIRSQTSTAETTIDFWNATDQTVQIYWLDFQGQKVKFNDLAAGQRKQLSTYRTHPWMVTDMSGQCILVALPDDHKEIKVASAARIVGGIIGGVIGSIAPAPAVGAALQISNDKLETFLRTKIAVWTIDDAKAGLGAPRDQQQGSGGTVLRFATPQSSFSSASLHFDSTGKLSTVELNPAQKVMWSAQLAFMKSKFPGEDFQLSQSGDNVVYTFSRSRTAFTVQPDGSILSASIF